MASSFQFLLLLGSFLFLVHQFHAQFSLLQTSIVLPVTKDLATLQYVTKMYHGTPLVPMNLVVDLGGPFLWTDCTFSASNHLVSSCSMQCSKVRGSGLEGKQNCKTGTWVSSQQLRSCDLSTQNSITLSGISGELVEDVIAVRSADESNPSSGSSITTISNFLYSCATSFLLNGLASGVHGMLGLGRTSIALPSQVSATFGMPRKFATCLSSSDGVILIGNLPGNPISRSLVYTPLVSSPSGNSQEYFIKVKSIKINSKRLSLNREVIGEAKISTVVPYTTLESSIYGTLVKAYLKAATFMNMTRVAPVAPFGLCFSSKGIGKTLLEPLVPTIDLVLQSEMVKWRIQGRNSLVPVKDDVMCLGFLDGGSSSNTSIVLGGFLLEDVLLEFDLGSSMLGFSSSLLMKETSCSKLMMAEYSMPRESL